MDYVGQEVVRLSTTPRWVDDKLEPRPFVLRVYCAATPERLARDARRLLPNIRSAGRARCFDGRRRRIADVWVLAERPVETSTFCPSPDGVRITRLLGNLPSRAADNLFWFGRYLERAEATLRVVRCLAARSVDPDAPMRVGRQALDRLMSVLVGWGAVDATALKEGADAAAAQGLRDSNHHGSALSLARAARTAASVIRERLTYKTWELIGRLENAIDPDPGTPVVRRGNRRPYGRGAEP